MHEVKFTLETKAVWWLHPHRFSCGAKTKQNTKSIATDEHVVLAFRSSICPHHFQWFLGVFRISFWLIIAVVQSCTTFARLWGTVQESIDYDKNNQNFFARIIQVNKIRRVFSGNMEKWKSNVVSLHWGGKHSKHFDCMQSRGLLTGRVGQRAQPDPRGPSVLQGTSGLELYKAMLTEAMLLNWNIAIRATIFFYIPKLNTFLDVVFPQIFVNFEKNMIYFKKFTFLYTI